MRQTKAVKSVLKTNVLREASKVQQGIVPRTTVASASKGKRI